MPHGEYVVKCRGIMYTVKCNKIKLTIKWLISISSEMEKTCSACNRKCGIFKIYQISVLLIIFSLWTMQVFSKLKEHRFPSEIELRDLVGRKLANLRVVDGIGGGLWSQCSLEAEVCYHSEFPTCNISYLCSDQNDCVFFSYL